MPDRTAREQSRRARIGCAEKRRRSPITPRRGCPALRRNAQAQGYHAEIQRLADQARRLSLHPTLSDRSNPNLSSSSVVGQRMAVSLGVERSNRLVDGAVEVIRAGERLMSEVMPLQVAPETLEP